jgi:plasmid stabilization system protein ParE
MDYKIIWSDEAIADLRNICSYIAQENPDAAERIGNGILDHVLILESFPYIGPPSPRGAHGPLRKLCSARTEFSRMFPKKPAVLISFMSGMVLATNRHFKRQTGFESSGAGASIRPRFQAGDFGHDFVGHLLVNLLDSLFGTRGGFGPLFLEP